MLVDDFIKYLKEQKDKNNIFELKGIIETTIKINKITVEEINKYLIIQSQTNQNEIIKINLHQLMKIKILNEKEYLLDFDQLQTIKISILN